MKEPHSRRVDLPFNWPDPPLNVVLVEPQIPPNTGNIARTCAATGSQLHLVGPLGFDINDRQLKRAGLDYWDSVCMAVHPDINDYLSKHPITTRTYLLSTAGRRALQDVNFEAGDTLVFGSETAGLSDEMLEEYPDQVVGLPMMTDHVRSLNLATTVGIAVYQALFCMNRS